MVRSRPHVAFLDLCSTFHAILISLPFSITTLHSASGVWISFTPTEGFDARLPFSGFQDDDFASVLSPRPLQGVSWPLVPLSRPLTPFGPPVNVYKRKRQRDSNDYPSVLHSESGDSLPRRPRKQRILCLSSSSSEGLSDIAITEACDFAAIKHNPSDVIPASICFANNRTPSAVGRLTPPSEAMSNHAAQVLHDPPRNGQGNEGFPGLDRSTPTHPLIVNGAGPRVCLEDSSPVSAIDFTKLQFPSRNRRRFPLLCLELVAEGEKGGEVSARPTSSDSSVARVAVVANDVPSTTQISSRLMMPQAGNSPNHEGNGTRFPLEHQGKRAEPSPSLRRLSQTTNSRDMVIYHMDQLLRTRGHAAGRDEVRFAMLWENNAMWKGKRFRHETLKKRRGREL